MRGQVFDRNKGKASKEPSWTVIVYRGKGADGKKKYEWKGGFPTKREASKALTEMLSGLDEGTHVEPRKLTLSDYLTKQWIPSIRSQVRPTTFSTYRTYAEKYVIPGLGDKPLQKLTTLDLSNFYSELSSTGVATARAG